VALKDLRASVGGGILRGGGTLTLLEGQPDVVDILATGSHLPIVRNDSLIVRANAGLRLNGPWKEPVLSGSIGVLDSLFYRDIELVPIGRPFTVPTAAELPKIDARKEPTAGVPEPFRNWRLDVVARTEEPFLVRGNLATGSAQGSLRIRGTLGDPEPLGDIVISDFVASLPFSTLSVRSGTLHFDPAGGFDPSLEIRGTANPRPYRVNVYVYGRASDPQLVLTSNPPLPENEIMTLLATGTTTEGLEDPQMASSRAIQLLLEELRRGRFRIGKSLRPVLKVLDRVDFNLAESDPYSGEAFSTATISLTDRWFLSAGMGEEGNSRIMVIWRLSFR
jgi:autotransporter translocation and assembly factor TamB